jgi:localization factor PodJL
MPSSDRFEPRQHPRQHPPGAGEPGASADVMGAPKAGPAARAQVQHFDPSQPWDAESAEALTRLYESDEGSLLKQYQGDRRQPSNWQAPASAPADTDGASAGGESDRVWLEARLADIARKLQGSLAGLNPDKSLASFNRRLDRIEERFGEALSQVAQRSDLEGLRLIEAQVLELAAHVEETRGRLHRIDAIDDNVQALASRLDEGGNQRLEALEKLLQDYVAEWRRGDERTTSTLRTLEDAVARIGDVVDAMEASKPAPDMSLVMLGRSDHGDPHRERDPLAQIYAEGERALAPRCYRSTLDAADYAPKPAPSSEAAIASALLAVPGERVAPPASDADAAGSASQAPPPVPPAAARDWPAPSAEGQQVKPAGQDLAPPAFRALALRAKLRQAQVLDAEAAGDELPGPRPVALDGGAAKSGTTAQPTRSGLLLAAGVALFAAGGYLAVDAFMSAGASPRGPGQIERGALPPDAKSILGEPNGQAVDLPPPADSNAWQRPDAQQEAGRPPSAPPYRQPMPETGDLTENAPPAPLNAVPGMGSALAAAFRAKAEARPPPAETAAIMRHDAPGQDLPASLRSVVLPMAIGPASLRQAAQRGDPIAQHEVAARYAAGHGVGQDLQQAFQWYARAAMRGLAAAQYRLAALHERGLGTAADPERAKVWYARAAEQGHVKSMHNLAVLSARGTSPDFAAAAKWFGQAAAFGLTDSQFNLAVLYQNGIGISKDLRQAYQWFALAARGGDSEAAGRLTQVKAQLGAGDLRAAEEMVAVWRPRLPDATINEMPPAALATGR